MTYAESASFYDIISITIQKWKKRLHSKSTRNIMPSKIPDDAVRKDVEHYFDDSHYERTRRFNYTTTPAICKALKRLSVSQKIDLSASKSLSNKKSSVS